MARCLSAFATAARALPRHSRRHTSPIGTQLESLAQRTPRALIASGACRFVAVVCRLLIQRIDGQTAQ